MKKKSRAIIKGGLIQARITTEEMRDIVTKATIYTKGNVSDFVREAVKNYRPLKRGPKL